MLSLIHIYVTKPLIRHSIAKGKFLQTNIGGTVYIVTGSVATLPLMTLLAERPTNMSNQ